MARRGACIVLLAFLLAACGSERSGSEFGKVCEAVRSGSPLPASDTVEIGTDPPPIGPWSGAPAAGCASRP